MLCRETTVVIVSGNLFIFLYVFYMTKPFWEVLAQRKMDFGDRVKMDGELAWMSILYRVKNKLLKMKIVKYIS